jgi:hypothetical protein
VRKLVVVVVVAAGLLGTASPATAALAFRFDRASAKPGTAVVAWQPGWRAAPHGVVAYLVPTRLPGVHPDLAGGYVLRRVPARHAIALGRPRPGSGNRLTLRFRVPQVPAGDYTIAFWCATCAPGGDFFASAPWGARSTGVAGNVLRVTR